MNQGRGTLTKLNSLARAPTPARTCLKIPTPYGSLAGGSGGLGTVETARQVVNRKKLMLQPETLQVASLPQRAVF
jgi:hypothetical protein